MSVIESSANLDKPDNRPADPDDKATPNDQATPDDRLATELSAERKHLIESRGALGRMRERAEALFATGSTVSGDPFAAESLGRQLARRIAELTDDPAAPLFFGRLDFGDGAGADEDHAGHTYH